MDPEVTKNKIPIQNKEQIKSEQVKADVVKDQRSAQFEQINVFVAVKVGVEFIENKINAIDHTAEWTTLDQGNLNDARTKIKEVLKLLAINKPV